MHLKIIGSVFFFIIFISSSVQADINTISRYVPQAQEVGSGRLTYIFWNVYDATLYAPEAQWSQSEPYALSISYLRKLKGKEIAKTSAEAIRDLGFSDEKTLHDWYRKMLMIFPDVDENTTLIGVRSNKGQTIFYNNGKIAGVMTDPAFADWFFGIWLNEKTQKPDLRRRLLGLQDK
jgi:hypothetical protein